MLCYCSKRNVTKLVFFVFSWLQPVLVGPLPASAYKSADSFVSFVHIWSSCCLLQRKDPITAGFLWPSSVWDGETLTFLLKMGKGSWTVAVAAAWNRFGEVEVLSVLFRNKPEPKAKLCGVGGRARPWFSLLQHTLPLLLQFTQGTVFPKEQTQTKLTGVELPLDYLRYLATDSRDFSV